MKDNIIFGSYIKQINFIHKVKSFFHIKLKFLFFRNLKYNFYSFLNRTNLVEIVWVYSSYEGWVPKFVVHWNNGVRTVKSYGLKGGTILQKDGSTGEFEQYICWCRWIRNPNKDYERLTQERDWTNKEPPNSIVD